MTEKKRFHFDYVCGDTGLIDEQAEHQWFIENCCSITDLKKNWKTVCNKLNELNEENKQLKEAINENSNMIDCFADEEVRLITENEKLKQENERLKKKNEAQNDTLNAIRVNIETVDKNNLEDLKTTIELIETILQTRGAL